MGRAAHPPYVFGARDRLGGRRVRDADELARDGNRAARGAHGPQVLDRLDDLPAWARLRNGDFSVPGGWDAFDVGQSASQMRDPRLAALGPWRARGLWADVLRTRLDSSFVDRGDGFDLLVSRFPLETG